MTIFEATQTVKVWINSCRTSEQVDLLVPYISDFFIPKFDKEIENGEGDKKVMKYELECSKVELVETIQTRKLILASTPQDREPKINEIL